jgi:hypothetical protein
MIKSGGAESPEREKIAWLCEAQELEAVMDKRLSLRGNLAVGMNKSDGLAVRVWRRRLRLRKTIYLLLARHL